MISMLLVIGCQTTPTAPEEPAPERVQESPATHPSTLPLLFLDVKPRNTPARPFELGAKVTDLTEDWCLEPSEMLKGYALKSCGVFHPPHIVKVDDEGRVIEVKAVVKEGCDELHAALVEALSDLEHQEGPFENWTGGPAKVAFRHHGSMCSPSWKIE